jgi:saccharopine dehydrogenase (NAD+, L-lysine forming)
MNLVLRSEVKKHERRTPIIPSHAKLLTQLGSKLGYSVKVEKSPNRIYPDNEYLAAGCELMNGAVWADMSLDHYIMGIKELPEDNFPLRHSHIYYAHAFKQQAGAAQILSRFKAGRGKIYDFEFLVDCFEKEIVVNSFSFWAGYCGAAIALLIWDAKLKGKKPPFKIPEYYSSRVDFENELRQLVANWPRKPNGLVIGANGRSAKGVLLLLKKFDIPITPWLRYHTQDRTEFSDILNYDLLFNCILLEKNTPPFLTPELVSNNTKLSIIADISCDVTSPWNPLPIYDKITTLANPTCQSLYSKTPLDIISIDNLASFFPLESSNDFSTLLLPYLIKLLALGADVHNSVWKNAENKFNEAYIMLESR